MAKEFVVKPNDFNKDAKFVQKTLYLQEDVVKRLNDFIDKYSNVYAKKVILNKLVKEILDEYEE